MFALGMLLQEDVLYDAEGQPLFDSTWNYKIPSAACIPRQLNIHMLKVSLCIALRYILDSAFRYSLCLALRYMALSCVHSSMTLSLCQSQSKQAGMLM